MFHLPHGVAHQQDTVGIDIELLPGQLGDAHHIALADPFIAGVSPPIRLQHDRIETVGDGIMTRIETGAGYIRTDCLDCSRVALTTSGYLRAGS